KRTNQLQAVIARVDVGGNRLLRRGFGESQTGVRATAKMNFRIGSMTIPVLTTAIYQLREEGRLKMSDPISEWVPGIPRASQVEVRMLMNNTSGYLDWVQGNETFVDAIHANPFRRWTGNELLNTALDRGFACEPGACFNYAHTNYLLLARILRRAEPGTTIARRMQKRVLRPLGINMTFSRLAPIPGPALAAYTSERGVFEQSTGWSPSWGLGNGMLATASIDNVTKEAKGVLSGRTLSRWSRKNMVKRFAPGIGPDPERAYFAQGLIMVNDWRRQNPFFNGYMGNVAWFPKRRIAISLVATTGLETTAPDGQNVTDAILDGIGSYLTPSNSPSLPQRG
ncbi:MAG: serine hydrolase domain-containing protein, partial [Solirubrobacterales bacterium]